MSITREQLVLDIQAMGFVYSHTTGSHMRFIHSTGASVGICHTSKNKVFGLPAYKQVIKEAKQGIERVKQLQAKRG